MKFAAVLNFLLVTTATAATTVHTAEVAAEDALKVIEGLVGKLGVADLSTLTVCVEDVEDKLALSVNNTVVAFKNVYREKSQKNVIYAMGALDSLMDEASDVFKTCKSVPKLQAFEDEINMIVNRVKQQLRKGAKEFLKTEANNFMSDATVFVDDIAAIDSAFEQKKYVLAGQTIGKLLDDIAEALIDTVSLTQSDVILTAINQDDVKHYGMESLDFVSGLIEGLGLGNESDVQKCLTEVETELADDVRSSYKSFKRLYEKGEHSYMAKMAAFATLEPLFEDAEKIFKQCKSSAKLDSFKVELNDLSQHMKAEYAKGLPTLFEDEGLEMMHNMSLLTSDAEAIDAAFKSMNFEEAGKSVAKLLNDAIFNPPKKMLLQAVALQDQPSVIVDGVVVVTDDVLQLIGGIMEGLGIATSADIVKCMGNIDDDLLSNAKMTFNSFYKAWKEHSEFAAMAGVGTLFELMSESKVVFESCKSVPSFGAFEERMKAFIQKVRSDFAQGWAKMLAGDSLAIFADGTYLTNDVRAIDAAFRAKQFNEAGKAIAVLFDEILTPHSQSVLVSYESIKDKAAEAEEVTRDIVEVLEGVLEGLSITTNAKIDTCVHDAEGMYANLLGAVTGFKNAFKQKEIKLIKSSFAQLSVVVSNVNTTLKDCAQTTSFQNFAARVSKVESMLAEHHHWTTMIKDGVVLIFTERKELTKDAIELFTSFEAKDYKKVGKAIGDIVNALLPQAVAYNELMLTAAGPDVKDVEDIAEVVEGFLEGLGVATTDKVDACLSDARDIHENLNTAAATFKSAFTQKHKITLFKSAFSLLGVVVQDVKLALHDCGSATDFKNVEERVNVVISSLEEHHGWLHVLSQEGRILVNRRVDITKHCVEVYHSYEEQKYNATGTAIGQIVNILLPEVNAELKTKVQQVSMSSF